jgi:predicted heme/steroid binding protein/uncharacterized membrane protein
LHNCLAAYHYYILREKDKNRCSRNSAPEVDVDMLELSTEELAEYNGKEGKPVYIAHEGKIYDVSGSNMWKTGTHMRRHHSGVDLTVDIGGAPHGPEVLERYPRVGVVKALPERKTGFLEKLFNRCPMLRRHPHPMTVHFPIVFMLSTTFFTLLYMATGNTSFEKTAFHCLVGGTLFAPLVIATGFLSWWVNYMGKILRPVVIKMIVSIIMLVVSVILVSWRAAVPDIITVFRPVSLIYLLLNMSLSPMVLVIGWYGAKLTFPIEKG